jgi:hypothetical protein
MENYKNGKVLSAKNDKLEILKAYLFTYLVSTPARESHLSFTCIIGVHINDNSNIFPSPKRSRRRTFFRHHFSVYPSELAGNPMRVMEMG